MKVRLFFSTFLLSILSVATLFAQTSSDPGGPCKFNDDDNTNCPLDSWVIVLAVFAVVFAAGYLYRKQKAAKAN